MSERWIVGIDGCPGGWVAIGQQGASALGEVRARVAPRLDELLAQFEPIRLAGIDMPIGLSEGAPRGCDLAARERLGARRSSVFPAPLRPALAAATHGEASDLSRQASGRGISVQAWHIFARVRELDTLLGEPKWRESLVEVHPELSFLTMNGAEPLPGSKHRIEGIYRRRDLIVAAFGRAAIDSAVAQLAGTRVKDDDMLDAFAVLWSAHRSVDGQAVCLPSDPPVDACGLPMRITF